MARKLSNQHYIDAVKLLRRGYYDSDRERYSGKFADGFEARDGFDLRHVDEWTTAQKAEVTRLYHQVDALMARPFKVVRPRKPENLRRLQKASQHPRHSGKLKVAFVPVARPGEDAEVKIHKATRAHPKGRVTIRERGVDREPVTFDDAGISFTDLENNTAGAMRELTKQFPGKLYVPMAGEYEIKNGRDAEGIADLIRKLMNEYGTANGHKPNDPNSHHYKNWLFGVAVYNFRTYKEFKAKRKEERKNAEALKKLRRRDRAKFRREHGARGKKKRRD